VIAAALEQVNEIRRTRLHEIVHTNVQCWVNGMQVAPQPPFDGVMGDLCHQYLFAMNVGRRATGQEKVHRLQDPATGKGRCRATADQQRLVDVVVEHAPKVIEIVARQSAAQLLAEEIANCIRMAEPLAFDDLNGTLRH
jgi:hypothetical protein